MKKLALAAALLLPVAASANIYSTSHNFAANTNAQSADREICRYCHVPHKNYDAKLIWNHKPSALADTWTWSHAETADGTPLTGVLGASAKCLSCHDGSTALGDVRNVGRGVEGSLTFIGNNVDAAGMLKTDGTAYAQLGQGGDFSLDNQTTGGNHPFGVPYAGQNGYLGKAQTLAKIGEGGYWPVSNGFTSPAAIGGAIPLKLHKDSGAYGVECGTCHDPHGKAGIPYLLRVTLVESALCRSCHAK